MKKLIFIIALILIIVIGLGLYNYIENPDKNVEEENKTSVVSDKKVEFDSAKMKSPGMVAYEEDTSPRSNAGLDIKIRSGKAYLTTNVEDEMYKFHYPEVTESLKDKELTGFSGSIKEVYYAYMGNGDMSAIILFLMTDGTVEYIDSAKMLRGERYESFGKVGEVSKVVRFVNLTATEVSENGELLGGYITVAAIDEDGYSFDLSQSQTLQENMLSSAL